MKNFITKTFNQKPFWLLAIYSEIMAIPGLSVTIKSSLYHEPTPHTVKHLISVS